MMEYVRRSEFEAVNENFLQSLHGPISDSRDCQETPAVAKAVDNVALSKTCISETSFARSQDSNRFVSSVYIRINKGLYDNSQVRRPIQIQGVTAGDYVDDKSSRSCSLNSEIPNGDRTCRKSSCSRNEGGGDSISFRFNVIDRINCSTCTNMAAATSPARTLPASSDLTPDKITAALPSVSLSTYQIIRRGSKTMLSDGGLLVPASSASPLLQMANDINTSLMAARGNGFRKVSDSTTSSDADKRTHRIPSAEYGRSFSSKSLSSLNKAADVDREFNNSESQNENFPQLSVFTRAGNSLLESQTASTLQKGKAPGGAVENKTNFSRPGSSGTHAIIASPQKEEQHQSSSSKNTQDSTWRSASSAQFSVEDSKLSNEIKLGTESQKHDLSGYALVKLSNSETQEPNPSPVSETKAKSSVSGKEKKDKKKNDKFKLPNTEWENKNQDGPQDGPQDRPQDRHNQKQIRSPQTPTHKTKSKFLTELYSGAEKIKNFINRGKTKKENNRLSSWLRSSQRSVHGSPEVPQNSLETTDTNVSYDSPDVGLRITKHITTACTSSETSNPTSACNLPSSGSVTDFLVTGHSREISSPSRKISSPNRKISSPSTEAGTASPASRTLKPNVLQNKSLKTIDVDVGKYVDGNDKTESKKTFVSSKPALHQSVRARSFSSQDFSGKFQPHSYDDDEVFTSPILENPTARAWSKTRRYSSIDFYLPKSKPKSLPSDDSSDRFDLPHIQQPQVEHSRSVHRRRRFSDPNINNYTRSQIYVALANGPSTHQRYSTSFFTSTLRGPRIQRRLHITQLPSDGIGLPYSAQPTPMTPSNISTRKSTQEPELFLTNSPEQGAHNPSIYSVSKSSDSKPTRPALKRSTLHFSFDGVYHRKPGISSVAYRNLEAQPSFVATEVVLTRDSNKDYVSQSSRIEKPDVDSGSLPKFELRDPSNSSYLPEGVDVDKDRKPYSYVDACKSEAELSQMLNSSEDINERRRIRARIRDLKAEQKNEGSGGGSFSDTATDSWQRERTMETKSVVRESTDEEADHGKTYEEMANLSELQTLLSETPNSGERNKIRDMIRRLRHKPERPKRSKSDVAELAAPSGRQTKLHESAAGASDHQRCFGATLASAVTLQSSTREQDSAPDSQRSPGVIAVHRLSSSALNFSETKSTFRSSTKINEKPAHEISKKPHEAAPSGHQKDITIGIRKLDNDVTYLSGNQSNNGDASALSSFEKGKIDDDSDVSSVLEHVKARLRSRDEILATGIKSQNYSSSPSENKSQETPDSVFGSRAEPVFHFPASTLESRTSSGTSEKSEKESRGRSSERASDKYREVREEILKSAKLVAFSKEGNEQRVFQQTSSQEDLSRVPTEGLAACSEIARSKNIDTPVASEPATNYKLQKRDDSHSTDRAKESIQLTDFQRLDKGLKPSKSKAFVSYLTAKFTGDKDNQLNSHALRRGQSLRSTVKTALPGANKSELHLVLAKTAAEGRSQDKREIDDISPNTGEKSRDHAENKQVKHSGAHIKNFDVPTISASVQPSTVNKATKQSDCIKSPTVFDSLDLNKQRSPAGTADLNEKTEVPIEKSTSLKSGRSIRRNWTDYRKGRPERYTSLLEIHLLTRSRENKDSGTQFTDETKQPAQEISFNKAHDDVASTTSRQSKEVQESDSCNNLQLETRCPVQTSKPGSGKAENAQTVDSSSDKLNDLNTAATKSFSAPAADSAHEPVTGQKPVPVERCQSNLHNTQPAASMERAFSMLLEDLDKISSSEGNPSDLDLSDGEDLLALSSSSADLTIKTNRPTSENRPVFAIEDSVVKEEEDHAMAESPGRSITDNSVRNAAVVQGEDETTSTTTEIPEQKSSSKEDSGVELGIDDNSLASSTKLEDKLMHMKQMAVCLSGEVVHVKKETPLPSTLLSPSMLENTHPQIEPSLTTKDTLSILGLSGGDTLYRTFTTMPGEEITRTSMEANATDTDVHHNVIPNNTTVVSSLTFVPSGNKTGTRLLNVNEEQDGTITMQAVAEDRNQNRIVTVRTRRQRTPSDADEEMKDTIVEKKRVSPSGSVLLERDVIQTKTRLTSRGSNYYTRSAHTTRTRRDRSGSEAVEHDVSVETDNKSVSRGQSWGDKAVMQVILEDAKNANAISSPISNPVPSDEVSTRMSANTQDEVENSNQTRWRRNIFVSSGERGSASGLEKNGGVNRAEVARHRETEVTEHHRSQSYEARPPEIPQALESVSVTEGSHVVLECVIASAQTSDIIWLKDGVEVSDTESYLCQFDAGTGRASLMIENAGIFDTAVYSCICRSGAGEARTQCRVLVKRRHKNPPTFVKPLTDVTVTEGHSTILSCTVSDASSVEWYKNGILQKHSADFKQTFDGREARLEMGEVFLEDEGEYACVVRNEAEEQRSSCVLSVKACDSETTVVPMFLTKLPNRALTDGDTLRLECDVIGSPDPRVTWLKEGKELGYHLTFSTSYDGRVATLEISGMTVQDAGCYSCVADNPAGKVSVDAQVTVQVKTRAPHFISKLEDVTVSPGKNVILRCEIAGSPHPTVSWRKNGRVVEVSHRSIQSYSNGVARLEILQVSSQDHGLYECVARNIVSVTSCQSRVEVVEPKAVHAQETEALKEEQITSTVPKLTRQRVFKKLSEPRPADIIAAVIQRASSHEVQRSHSFGPSSVSVKRDNSEIDRARGVNSYSPASFWEPERAPREPETVSVVRNSIRAPPKPDRGGSVFSGPGNTTGQRDSHNSSESEIAINVDLSRAASLKPAKSQQHLASPLSRLSNLGRSASMHTVRSNNFSNPDTDFRAVWTPPSMDQPDSRETNTKSALLAVKTELRPSIQIRGYRPVSPMFSGSSERDKVAPSPLSKDTRNIRDGSLESHRQTEQVTTKKTEDHLSSSYLFSPYSSTPSSAMTTSHWSSPHRTASEIGNRFNTSASSSSTSLSTPSSTSLSTPSSTLPVNQGPYMGSSQQYYHQQDTPSTKVQPPRVITLREQFLSNDGSATTHQQIKPQTGSAINIRRVHSLPPQENKPSTFQRKQVDTPRLSIMPSYDQITDEEELHKLMNATEDFEERKKIRARLREIRDKQREEMEAKRKQREAEAEDIVKKKFERAEEEKRKKMEAYKHQAPTHERDSKYHEVTQNLIQEKYKAAEEEKARKMAAYSAIAAKTGPGGEETTTTSTTSSVQKTPGGGTRTVTQKTTETTTKGFGGTAYGKPAEVTARELAEQLMRSSGPGISGHITVRTEAWNSSDGQVQRSQKSHSWGAKPQGAKSAMAAFKQMDNASNPEGAAKPKAMARSPSAIKDMLLNWAKAMTQGYPGVEVTNFSSSWNNGMAFCALIHHFFPNAFDFNKLDPKQRRYNFTLAFDTAEKEADIAPLLDVEDMVKMKNPDWKCVFTYVQSIYRHLKDHENNKAGPSEQ